MANFALYTEDEVENFADPSTYKFNTAGLLVIDEGHGVSRTYSPNAWRYIAETKPPKAPKEPRGAIVF